MVGTKQAKHLPKEISPEALSRAQLGSGVKIDLGFLGRQGAGAIVYGFDGRRLILCAGNVNVVYLLVDSLSPLSNRAFIQHVSGFVEDVRLWHVGEAGRRGAAIVRLAEFQVHFIMGVCAATSGIGLIVTLGAGVLDFAIRHRDDFPKWIKAYEVLSSVEDELSLRCPILAEKLDSLLYHGLLNGALATFPAAAKNPRIAGRVTGAIIGHVGKATFRGNLTVAGVLFAGLWQVACAAVKAVPDVINAAGQGFQSQSVANIVRTLRDGGVEISNTEAMQILKEVASNQQQVSASLKKLRDAFAPFK